MLSVEKEKQLLSAVINRDFAYSIRHGYTHPKAQEEKLMLEY